MFRRPPRRQASVEEGGAVAASSQPSEARDDLRGLLDQVEATALGVFALHGLPSASGHYRQPPGSERWEHLAHALTPAEKWALLDENPTDQGWRYASLEQIGARSTIADVRHASGLLSACRGLRLRLDESTAPSPQDVADAIRLGVTWRRLAESGSSARTPLQFHSPDQD